MKLYKIRGTSEWVPWDVLYNERGYNYVPCIDMTYKSISPWGTSAGSGYRTNSSGNVTYFVSGETGWKLAFSLPEALGVYPDEATPIQMIKDGVISDAVWMEFWGAKWYLIQAEIANERYWIHELALPDYGWEIYEGKDYEFILVDGTTGRVVHGVEQLNEMVFAPTGYFTIENTSDVVFVEKSPYPIVSHFHVDFDTVQTLADGAYIDTILPYYASKLYIAGTVNRIAGTVVDFGLDVSNEGEYVRVTNNTGASVTLTRLAIQSMDAAGAEVVEVVDGQDNHAYAFKWDGGTPYWWISYYGERHWTDALGAWSEMPPTNISAEPGIAVQSASGTDVNGTVFDYVSIKPSVTVTLRLSVTYGNVQFSANDYWFAVLRSQEDADTLDAFGCYMPFTTDGGTVSPYGAPAYKPNEYSYEILYLTKLNSVTVLPSDKYVGKYSDVVSNAGTSGDGVIIRSISADAQSYVSWTLKITKL